MSSNHALRRVAALAAATLLGSTLAGPALAADEPPTGTAETSFTALDVRLDGASLLTVLQGGTSASTVGAPASLSSLTGLVTPVGSFGGVRAEHDGETSASSAVVDETVGGVAVRVAPLSAAAETTAAGASASLVGASADVVAEVEGLLGQLGLSVDALGATSTVGSGGAVAIQTLRVSGLELTLGDLVPALANLPLGSVLDLLDALGTGNSNALVQALGALRAAEADVEQDLAELQTAVETLVTAAGDATGPLADLAAFDAAVQGVLGAVVVLPADALVLVGGLGALGLTVPAGCVPDAILDVILDPAGCVAAIADLVSARAAELAQPVASARADVESALLALTGEGGSLPALTSVLATLTDVLDEVLAALPDLAGTSLLSLDQVSVGPVAVAGPDLASSAASLTCSARLVVLGTPVLDGTCEATAEAVTAVQATADEAIAAVRSVLELLPLDAGADLTGLDVSVLRDVTDPARCPEGAPYARTCTVDGTQHAVAGVEVLALSLPSVTLDPLAATGTIADLGLDLGIVTDLLDAADTAVADLLAAGQEAVTVAGQFGGDETFPLTGDAIDATAVLAALSALGDAFDALDLGTLGTLADEGVTLSTPAVELVVDPTSAASFTAGSTSGGPGGGDGDGDPAPDPTLPSTGGGLALLGLSAIGAAGVLARRRRD